MQPYHYTKVYTVMYVRSKKFCMEYGVSGTEMQFVSKTLVQGKTVEKYLMQVVSTLPYAQFSPRRPLFSRRAKFISLIN